MPGKIKLLDPIVASQIAAGEVIERPASVVKELVENALDAGATRVAVEIEEGGKRLLRVTDNGCGMSPEDAVLSLQRHATSKIRTAEDLHGLRTLGFRGEALPSIASVSHLTLQTREPDQVAGVELRVEGGTVVAFHEAGGPPGTTVMVQRLFYNVPARLKFLKATNTERNHVLDVLRGFALRYLPVAFRLVHGGQELLQVPPAAHLSERLVPLLGRDLAREMIPVELAAGDLKVSGSIGKPSISRANREHQTFFVNGHFVRDRLLRLALYEGYHTLLVRDRHPVAVLWIDVAPDQVDVNVHPTKAEVRFSHEVEVHRLVARAVREALERMSLFGGDAWSPPKRDAAATPPPTARGREGTEGEGRGGKGREGDTPSPLTAPGRPAAAPSLPGLDGTPFPSVPDYERNGTSVPDYEPAPSAPSAETVSTSETTGRRAPSVRDYTTAPRSYQPASSPESQPAEGVPDHGSRLTDHASRITPHGSRLTDHASPPAPPAPGPLPVRPPATPADREAFQEVLRQRFAGPQGALPQTGLSPFHRFFGQVLGRYFVAETDEGFVLIDQHAAHQQILRAQWQEWWSKRRVPVVRRDPPVAVDVPKKTVKLLQEGRTLVQALGLDLEAFGGTAFLVRAVPEVADHVPAQDLVVAAVMALVEASDQPEEQRPLRVIEALTRQCALPAGKVMDAEAQADFVTLLQAWLPTLNAPEAALAEVTLGDLEKMFQRR